MITLGIETSCDETAAAVVDVTDTPHTSRLLGATVYSQLAEHFDYGGVVPELASRAHLERLGSLSRQALADAGLTFQDLDGIAVTTGPGLMGGLLVGSSYARSLAMALELPWIGVNHLEGHALTAHLTEKMPFPYLLLLVSGGHCQFIAVDGPGRYRTLGGTLDDAIGECFDKVARLLGLPYPGGPAVEQRAQHGDPSAFTFPLPLKDKGVDFSFSGLKTAVRRTIETLPGPLDETVVNNICASFQDTVAQLLEIKTARSISQTGAERFVLAGGVAANQLLRARLQAVCQQQGAAFHAPPVHLCTDNAVMIAYAGGLRLLAGEASPDGTSACPRWPLDSLVPPGQPPMK